LGSFALATEVATLVLGQPVDQPETAADD
jgi:hypothetical protein